MKIIIILLLFLLFLLFLSIHTSDIETFDHAGKYAWYRTPYSWYYWQNAMRRQELWNLFHRRKYLSIDNFLYLP